MSNDEPKPGDVVVYDELEFFAAPQKENTGCRSGQFRCEFDVTLNDRRCSLTSCGGVIWLTKLDYITHRLTS